MLDNIKQLQWACRRGMLELDLLLGNFLSARYSTLTPQEKSQFTHLLEFSDADLIELFLNQEKIMHHPLKDIINLIKNHARSRI